MNAVRPLTVGSDSRPWNLGIFHDNGKCDFPRLRVGKTAAPAGDMPAILSIDDAAQRWMDNEDAEAANPAEASAPSQRGSRTGRDRDRRGGRVDRARGGRSANSTRRGRVHRWDRISPDKKMRLRDGFEFDKKFVNENIDKIRKLPEIERELTARVQQFRDAQAQHAQKRAVPCPGSPAGHRQRTGGDPAGT